MEELFSFLSLQGLSQETRRYRPAPMSINPSFHEIKDLLHMDPPVLPQVTPVPFH